METSLKLSIGGFPPFSAKGCTQELTVIPIAKLVRTVNGELVSLGEPSIKYRAVITCDDREPFASGGLFRGQIVEVECLQKLSMKVSGSGMVLDRDPVEGSVECAGAYTIKGRAIIFDQEIEGFLSYRPKLLMRVMSFSLTTQEWEQKSSWRLEMEEV